MFSQKSWKVGRGCAIGILVGMFTVISFIAMYGMEYWQLILAVGMLAGLAGGYLAYDFKKVIVRSGEAIALEVKSLRETNVKKFRIHPFFVFFLLLFFLVYPFIVLLVLGDYNLISDNIYALSGARANSFFISIFISFAICFPIPFLIGENFHNKIYICSSRKENGKIWISLEKISYLHYMDLIFRGMFFGSLYLWGLLHYLVCLLVVFITKVLWRIFKFIHCQERVLCGTYSMISVGSLLTYSFYQQLPLPVMIYLSLGGAIVGDVAGAFIWEFISVGFFHVDEAPATA